MADPSHDEIFCDWESLLRACRLLAPQLPPGFYERYCVPLEILLGVCQEAEAEAEALMKAARDLTQHVQTGIREGQECARRTRRRLLDIGYAFKA